MKTTRIIYVGKLPRGAVDWRGASYNFTLNVPVEFPAELADELIQSDSWKLAEEVEHKTKKKERGAKSWR